MGYYATPIIALQNYVNKGYVKVNHKDLGELIGRITAAYNTGNPLTDYIDMEYYDPRTGNVAFSQLSAQDLSAPQQYTGPIPPVKTPIGGPGGERWVFIPGIGWILMRVYGL
ncbi:hypothetical protein [Paenibacillus popilliae]|uniref:Amino acid transporter n=1 Tax=Paenibacillus popilliae ATCC 14706 TaxID=1212764 RepID=M9M0I5_PAEPP|nr:hypothetical protein [Paenibacillus popilliae]GAC42294.1 amino acid transporter [Paenibacillus popilliae ATCC 14706]